MTILIWRPSDTMMVRKVLKLSQPDIAKTLGISKQTISLLEREKHYSIPTLVAVSVVLEKYLMESNQNQCMKESLLSIRVPLEEIL